MNDSGGKTEGRPKGGGKNRGNGSRTSAREEGGEYRNGFQNGGRGERGNRKERNGRKDRNGRNSFSGSKRGEGENNKKFPENNRGSIPAYQKPRVASFRDRQRFGLYDGPKWTPAKKPNEPIPEITCSLCGKPIPDLASAMSDREGEGASHFDCIIARLKERETLDAGDSFAYIGGGRFGVVHHDSPKKFSIKKIIEWDQREERVPWRKLVADYYSST
jgi:hypothetical protein